MLRDPKRRPSRYHSFILSLWEESGAFPGEANTWRFSLEQAQAAGRKGFKNLAELTAYLDTWTQASPGDAPLAPSENGEPDTS